jgi:hypothetical protein
MRERRVSSRRSCNEGTATREKAREVLEGEIEGINSTEIGRMRKAK